MHSLIIPCISTATDDLLLQYYFRAVNSTVTAARGPETWQKSTAPSIEVLLTSTFWKILRITRSCSELRRFTRRTLRCIRIRDQATLTSCNTLPISPLSAISQPLAVSAARILALYPTSRRAEDSHRSPDSRLYIIHRRLAQSRWRRDTHHRHHHQHRLS